MGRMDLAADRLTLAGKRTSLKRNPTLVSALESIAAELRLDAKRPPKSAGIDSWYPYYAGFSTKFAFDVLRAAPLKPGARVLDPWNGSGTTTYAASRIGLNSIGFDINPVANLVAQAKVVHPDDATKGTDIAYRIATEAKLCAYEPRGDDPLAPWLAPRAVASYRILERLILSKLASTSGGRVVRSTAVTLPPRASFMLLALMRAARAIASLKTTTNPTWIRPGINADGDTRLAEGWIAMVERMCADIRSSDPPLSRTRTGLRDARNLKLGDSSVDFVLTSPPYCTRIDYVVNTSFELAALSIAVTDTRFHSLRMRTMGSPIVPKGPPEPVPATWPLGVRKVLELVKSHPSRDSRSYYYKTYRTYFAHCMKALCELQRVLKPGGAAVLVVQSSYYKDVCIDLPELYVEIGRGLGLYGRVLSEVRLTRYLAQINSKSARYGEKDGYREAVVILGK
ncbi:DNA methyltransferase [Polyangium spumosum]|uniref:site-specific DNA-methyltransferase (cytosine-N(4)-specific) n=1 Tax=Polyangium spumosum TaxID=889282 RepID=A0A6N7Q788_9BACT|nr:hypothetical protein [Polyangium spumosum]